MDTKNPTTEEPTMTVTVRDSAAEPPWGSGPLTVVTRKVTISAQCPTCSKPRGEPKGSNESEDGVYYWVQRWDNPCGHIDLYAAVIKEARTHHPQHFGTGMRH